MVRMIVCESARTEELLPALMEAGCTTSSQIITAGSIPVGSAVTWVGMPPSPDGGTFDLHAPIEGAAAEPRWARYSAGWNFTRDLVAFRVSSE